MIRQIDAAWWYKLNGALRWCLVHNGHRVGFFPLINEYPKSGGSWLAQMLAECLHLPFPRNRLPMLRPSVLHGHYRRRRGMRDVVVVWRDGRDVMVSWYFHRVVGNEYSSRRIAEQVRKDLDIRDPDDYEKYLPRFIEYSLTRPKHPGFTWVDFVADWLDDRNAVEVRYEELLSDTADVLRRTAHALTGDTISVEVSEKIAERYAFSVQSDRTQGQESRKRYLRKGVAGDWRNKFSSESRQIFHHFAGNALIALSYEKDGSWVDQRN